MVWQSSRFTDLSAKARALEAEQESWIGPKPENRSGNRPSFEQGENLGHGESYGTQEGSSRGKAENIADSAREARFWLLGIFRDALELG